MAVHGKVRQQAKARGIRFSRHGKGGSILRRSEYPVREAEQGLLALPLRRGGQGSGEGNGVSLACRFVTCFFYKDQAAHALAVDLFHLQKQRGAVFALAALHYGARNGKPPVTVFLCLSRRSNLLA